MSLGLPQQSLTVDGCYFQDSTRRTGLPDVTATDYVEELQGELIVSVSPPVSTLLADIRSLKEEAKEQRSRSEQLQEEAKEQRSRSEQLQAEVQGLTKDVNVLKAQNAILVEDSKLYQEVVLRYVVDQVHEKLQDKFGEKQEGVKWEDYVSSALKKDPSWFVTTGLADNLSLLYKGYGTAFQAGNDAAHEPPEAVVDRVVRAAARQEPAWAKLWRLARSV